MSERAAWQVEVLPDVTPGTWPFHADWFHMGAVPAKDFAVMFANFGQEMSSTGYPDRNRYVILHHIPSGKRVRIELP